MSDRLAELWEHIRDPYWRLDHPEVTMLLLSVISGLIGVISGLIGLVFAYLQKLLLGERNGPDA